MKDLHEALIEFGEQEDTEGLKSLPAEILTGKQIKKLLWFAVLKDAFDWLDKKYGDTII